MLSRPRPRIGTSLMRGVPQAFQLNTIAPASLAATVEAKSNAPIPKVTFAQTGRGSFNTQQAPKEFTPANEDRKTRKKKLPNGLTQITEVKDKSKVLAEEAMDENGTINWEVLEEGRKRKPCVKLLKKLEKGKEKKKFVK